MASAVGAALGLNILQIVQNELQSREILEGNLDYGTRLRIIDERLQNAEAHSRNSRVWKLHHHLEPISAPQKQKRSKRKDWEVHEWFPKTVGEFKGLTNEPERIRALLTFYNITVYAVRHEDDEDVDDLSSSTSDSDSDSDSEAAHYAIPPTPRHSNGQHGNMRIAKLRIVDTHRSDQLRDIQNNIEGCMEELAIAWGLDWQRVGGLAIPPRDANAPRPPTSKQDQYMPPRQAPWNSQGKEKNGLDFRNLSNVSNGRAWARQEAPGKFSMSSA